MATNQARQIYHERAILGTNYVWPTPLCVLWGCFPDGWIHSSKSSFRGLISMGALGPSSTFLLKVLGASSHTFLAMSIVEIKSFQKYVWFIWVRLCQIKFKHSRLQIPNGVPNISFQLPHLSLKIFRVFSNLILICLNLKQCYSHERK